MLPALVSKTIKMFAFIFQCPNNLEDFKNNSPKWIARRPSMKSGGIIWILSHYIVKLLYYYTANINTIYVRSQHSIRTVHISCDKQVSSPMSSSWFWHILCAKGQNKSSTNPCKWEIPVILGTLNLLWLGSADVQPSVPECLQRWTMSTDLKDFLLQAIEKTDSQSFTGCQSLSNFLLI